MARNKVGVPYQNPTRYVGPNTDLIPIIKVSREPTTNDVRFPLGQFWLVGDNPTTGTVGDLWYLCDFVAGVPTWCQVDVGSGGPGVDQLRDQVDATASPDASGNIDIDGTIVGSGNNPSGIPLETVAGTNKIDIQLQLAAARTGAPGDSNDAGVCSFDDTAFSVDADGYVTLAGGAGPAVDTINVDGNTGPGTDPVVPDGSGVIAVAGNTVANATNAQPVFTHSRAANAYNLEVQVATAIAAAPGDKLDAGLSSFDSGEFNVDADGFVQLSSGLKAPMTVNGGSVINIGFTLSTQTLTVHGADGTALSATNPGYVLVQDPANANQMKVFTVTANQAMTNTEMNGNTHGTTASTAWGSAMPLFVYAMTNDASDSIQFALGRLPHLKVSPAAANIGDPSAANADQEFSLYSFDDITEADWDANPVICVGSLRATKDASDVWTFAAMDEGDGVGQFNDGRNHDFPTLQFGASAGHMLPNGGTAPAFTTVEAEYVIHRNGWFDVTYTAEGDGGTDGSGAVDSYWVTPFEIDDVHTATFVSMGTGRIDYNAGTYVGVLIAGNGGTHSFLANNFVAAGAVQNAAFVNGDRNYGIYCRFLASTS